MSERYFLGIELGGTKLQVGRSRGRKTALEQLWREKIEAAAGADALREQLRQLMTRVFQESGSACSGIAIAFGGPVDTTRGIIVKSHQVQGWEGFPIVDWFQKEFGIPAILHNDADTAAFAEATLGAGQGFDPVLFLTVGSGIGGGLILGGKIYRGEGAGAMEIGHLRPGGIPRHPPAPEQYTVEGIGSGFGITSRAQRAIQDWLDAREYARAHHRETSPLLQGSAQFDPERSRFQHLWRLIQGNVESINTELVAKGALEGDPLCLELLMDATETIGWGIAQAITLINPARIVIGGGVSLIGEELFFGPIREAVKKYVFAPFAGKAEIVPSMLQEEVVVHGALALAEADCLGRLLHAVGMEDTGGSRPPLAAAAIMPRPEQPAAATFLHQESGDH